jgi:prepilin-type N-terminal cleavage/methylation domain-containing protein
MKRRTNSGFSLLELLIVLTLIGLITVPAYRIYVSGMKSSLSGIVSLEIQTEGEKILMQVRDDLRNSCFPYEGAVEFSFDSFLTITPGSGPSLAGTSYSCYRFGKNEVQMISSLPQAGKANRPVERITYRLKSSSQPHLHLLTRAIGEDGPEVVLSKRVNFLQVVPVQLEQGSTLDGNSQWFWNVYFQLADLPKDLPVTGGPLLANRSKGIIIADFYDIVSSDFFSCAWNFRWSPRSWHAGLRGNEGL